MAQEFPIDAPECGKKANVSFDTSASGSDSTVAARRRPGLILWFIMPESRAKPVGSDYG